MKFTRKDFVKGIALGTITLPIWLRSFMGKNYANQSVSETENRVSGKKYRWKMVTTWPPNFPVLGEACTYYADIVKAMSGGRIEIRVYGGGELVPALEVFDTVRTGGAEMGCGASYYWAGKSPATQFFTSVPFGMNAQQMHSWLLWGGGMELWEELYAEFNLVPMIGGNTGMQMGGWFNREINTIDDLKGLKMRLPGLGGKVLEKAGGTPVLLAGGEIYTGLERGVIDATEWLGPFHDYMSGFQQISKYYYTPGWHEVGSVLEFTINKELYDSLPDDLKAILKAAAAEASNWCFAGMETKNAEQLAIMKAEGVEIRSFPKEVLDQLRIYSEEVLEELSATDPRSKKVYDSFKKFRDTISPYSGITEKLFFERIQK